MNHSRSERFSDAARFEAAFGAVWAAFHRADDATDGLGQLERQILHHVSGETSPSAVADHLGLARSTTTVILQGLHAKGLITRRRSADDERRVVVSRTAAGDRLVASDGFLRRRDLARALDQLPASLRRDLVRGLERLGATSEGSLPRH